MPGVATCAQDRTTPQASKGQECQGKGPLDFWSSTLEAAKRPALPVPRLTMAERVGAPQTLGEDIAAP